jgi:hypothetical protein
MNTGRTRSPEVEEIRQSIDDRLVPDPQVQWRYGVSGMTLWRWDHNPQLKFPAPIRINGRKYRRLSDLIAWERGQTLPREAA